MQIRIMTNSDISDVRLLETECFNQSLEENFFQRQLKNEYAYFLVAIEKSKIIAYISSILEIKAEILNFCVKKEYRHLGIGNSLLNKVIEKASENKCESIYLEVSNSNLNAIYLYKKCGFDISYIRKHYYKDEDAYVMIKEL